MAKDQHYKRKPTLKGFLTKLQKVKRFLLYSTDTYSITYIIIYA